MVKILRTGMVAIAMLVFALVQVAAKDRYFILAGQSNMVGQGKVKKLPDKFRMIAKNVAIYSSDNYEKTLNTGLGNKKLFGPEITFSHALSRYYPEDRIVILKFAVGGSSLLAWSPNWDRQSAAITKDEEKGPLYSKMITFFEKLPLFNNKELSKLSIDGILWMQGEKDARFPAAGNNYLDNIITLIKALRTDFDAKNTPFILGRVDPPAVIYPARDTVRDQQFQIQSEYPNVTMVDADGLSKWDDNLHFDTKGQLELGLRFAKVYINLIDQNK